MRKMHLGKVALAIAHLIFSGCSKPMTSAEKEQLYSKTMAQIDSLSKIPSTASEVTSKFKIMEMLAKEGYSDAQLVVGAAYLEGKIVPQNLEKSYYWTNLVYSDTNCPSAAFRCITAANNLAYMYLNGAYVNKNEDIADSIFEVAALLGDSTALLYLGEKILEDPDKMKERFGKLIPIIDSLANSGSFHAKRIVAFYHANGIGFEENKKEFLRLLSESAAQDRIAQKKMGDIYQDGFDTIKSNLGKAVMWYQLSSDNDFCPAKGRLCYLLWRIGKYESEKLSTLCKSAANECSDTDTGVTIVLTYLRKKGIGLNEVEKRQRTIDSMSNYLRKRVIGNNICQKLSIIQCASIYGVDVNCVSQFNSMIGTLPHSEQISTCKEQFSNSLDMFFDKNSGVAETVIKKMKGLGFIE